MSPIKGITDKVLLPRLGKIKLGIRVGTHSGLDGATPTDYFVCPDELKKIFGEKPRELRIMFPTEDREQCASQYLRRYSDSLQLLCRGDGQKAITYDSQRINESVPTSSAPYLKETICDPSTCRYYQVGDCRRIMNLQFLVPDCPGFGVYQLDTGSFYSIRNINSALTFIRSISPRLSMIPLSLQLVEKDIYLEGCSKTIFVLKLTWKQSIVELQKFAQTPPGQALLISPPDCEPPEDIALSDTSPNNAKSSVSTEEESLMDLWARAKSKIWHYDIRDYQLTRWFDKNYGFKVTLKDFDPPVPSNKFTSAMLSFFCEYVDLVCLPQF
jgi:hypothetical protein